MFFRKPLNIVCFHYIFNIGKTIVNLNIILALLSLGVCVVLVGNNPIHIWSAKLSRIWKPLLMVSNENCNPAFIPVLGCSSTVTSVQFWCKVHQNWVQAAGAVGPSGLGICLGGDESASQPAKSSLFLAWPCLTASWLKGHIRKWNEGSQRRAEKG